MKSKMSFIACVFGALTAVGSALAWFGSTQWANKETNEANHSAMIERVVVNEKDILKLDGKLDKIDERTQEIRAIQREILREVRK